MGSVDCANVDIRKLLSSGEPTEVQWKCSDFALKMLEEGIYSDITFVGLDGSVNAHRSVLACVCPSLSEKEPLSKIIGIDMPIEALKLFLLLLYTTSGDDAVEVPQLSRVIDKQFEELYAAVSKYEVESRLGFVLLPALARKLNPGNCWSYYEDSLKVKHVAYKNSSSETCYNYILGNYAEVIKSNSFPVEMKENTERVYRIILHAESQASRQEALRSFQAKLNFKRTDNEAEGRRSNSAKDISVQTE